MIQTGTRLGLYEVIAAVGAGGMGEVYRARDTKLQRDVALKVLPDSFATDPDRLARFTREAQVLASLNHPNIASIYGVEDTSGHKALVLELVEGPTLAEKLASGSALPLDEVIQIARQIADALEVAHEQGIIHRDLKPANIKLKPDGTVKVLDFGLAKLVDTSPDFDSKSGGISTDPRFMASMASHSPTMTSPATRLGVILGTAAYMSPEQAKGKPVDRRADIWAFGCVLYEMLTGRRAFKGGEDISDTLVSVLRDEPDFGALPPSTPSSIRQLLRRTFAKDPRRRLQHIGDARIELLEPFAEPANEAPTSAAAHSRRLGTTAWMMTAGALLAGAVGMAAVGFWLWPTIAPVFQTRFQVALSATIDTGDFVPDVAISPDGRRVAIVGDSQLFLRDVDQLEAVPLARLGSVRESTFSPDGKWIAYFATNNELRRAALAGGPVSTICMAGNNSRGGTWTPDDLIVFATADTGTGLYKVSAAGGTPSLLTTPDAGQNEGDHIYPEVMPDGQTVIFTILAGTGGSLEGARIAALNLKTGARKVIVNGGSHGQYADGYLIYASQGTIFAVPFDPDRLETRGDPVPVVEHVATTSAGAANAALARNGTLVYVAGDQAGGARTLVWVDRQGKETPLEVEPKPYAVPRLSPDGTRIVTNLENANADIAISDIGRHTTFPLTFDQSQELRPMWTRDGRWVLFRSEVNGPGISRKAGDGTGAVERLVAIEGDGSPNDNSPDSKLVVISQVSPTTARDLWLLDVETRKVTPLVVEPGQQGNAVISPDGHWLAYQVETEGHIWVRPFPNVGAGQWVVAGPGCKWPLWSKDGHELFYVCGRALTAARVDPSAGSFKWEPAKVLFERSYVAFPGLGGPRNYDVSRDGRFLVVKSGATASGTTSVVVVENWADELKQRVPKK